MAKLIMRRISAVAKMDFRKIGGKNTKFGNGGGIKPKRSDQVRTN